MKNSIKTLVILMTVSFAATAFAGIDNIDDVSDYQDDYWHFNLDNLMSAKSASANYSEVQKSVDEQLLVAFSSSEYQTAADTCPAGSHMQGAEAISDLEKLQDRIGQE